jgi:hypothetical protein
MSTDDADSGPYFQVGIVYDGGEVWRVVLAVTIDGVTVPFQSAVPLTNRAVAEANARVLHDRLRQLAIVGDEEMSNA